MNIFNCGDKKWLVRHRKGSWQYSLSGSGQWIRADFAPLDQQLRDLRFLPSKLCHSCAMDDFLELLDEAISNVTKSTN